MKINLIKTEAKWKKEMRNVTLMSIPSSLDKSFNILYRATVICNATN